MTRAQFVATVAVAVPLAFAPAPAHAGCGSSLDLNFVKQIRAAIESYGLEHDGALPVRWSDLDPYLQGGVAGAGRHIEGTDRYALLSPPVSFSDPFEGELVVVTRRAFREMSRPERPWPFWGGARLGNPHHHAVLRSPSTGITRHVFTEDEMRAV